jgi:hypothetical protein
MKCAQGTWLVDSGASVHAVGDLKDVEEAWAATTASEAVDSLGGVLRYSKYARWEARRKEQFDWTCTIQSIFRVWTQACCLCRVLSKGGSVFARIWMRSWTLRESR